MKTMAKLPNQSAIAQEVPVCRASAGPGAGASAGDRRDLWCGALPWPERGATLPKRQTAGRSGAGPAVRKRTLIPGQRNFLLHPHSNEETTR